MDISALLFLKLSAAIMSDAFSKQKLTTIATQGDVN
jgi:hypothetical protein